MLIKDSESPQKDKVRVNFLLMVCNYMETNVRRRTDS